MNPNLIVRVVYCIHTLELVTYLPSRPLSGIVITDIDSFAQSDDEEDPNVTINPVLLDRIRTNKFDSCTNSQSTTPSSTSQALVLFQPLPLSEMEMERVKEAQAKQKQETEVKRAETDEDAMDIEP